MAVKPVTTYPAIIGRIIADKRKQKGWDQGAAAEAAGINRSSWSRIENGESVPDAVQLTKISNALGCSSADIMVSADNAKKILEKQGVEVHMESAAKSKKSSGGFLALLGAAAVGALIAAAVASDSDSNKKK